MIRRIFFLFILMFSISSMLGAELDKAAVAYQKGEYAESIALMDSVMKSEGFSAALLYNMGNAYLKAGDYGNAMLEYKRAYLLDPSDKALKNNISYLASKVEDNNKAETKGKKISVSPEEHTFFGSIKNFISFSHLPDTWGFWAGCLFVLTCGFAALYIFVSNVLIRKIGFFGGIVSLSFSILTLLCAFIAVSVRNNTHEGVIVSHKVLLHTEPYQSSKTNTWALTKGTILNILSSEADSDGDGKWYKVYLNPDFSGWIKSADFEEI